MTPCLADQNADIEYLNGCLKSLPARTKPGLEHLTSFCPELTRTLQQAGVTQRLSEDWEKFLAPAGLRDINRLLQRYQGEPPSTTPQTSSIQAISEALRTQQPPRSGWQQFGDWLRHLLQRQHSEGPGLMDRMLNGVLDSMTARVRRVLFYGLLAAMLLLMGGIVWRELKAAGIGRRSAPRTRRGTAPLLFGDSEEPLLPDTLDTVSLAERPVLLLRLLVQALQRMGRLAADRSLTHRELIARASLDDSNQRQRFAGISLRAEQQLYGGAAPLSTDDPELQSIVREGRELYSQLLGIESARS
jgi:hypothetical protein